MTAAKLTLDSASSKLTVRTRAKGLLARLAHDLEIGATRLVGTASVDGDAWSGEIVLSVAALEVVGVVKDGRVDRGVLSPSDRAEILKRMKSDAFRGATEVRVEARGPSRSQADLTVRIANTECRLVSPMAAHTEGDRTRVQGSATLSLRALGSREIKAPLGAFSVEDAIAVSFDLAFSLSE